MPSPILNKCRLYETRDDLRSHCNEPQMMRGEITFHDYEAGTAVLLTGSRLPADVTVFRPDAEKDIAHSMRVWSHSAQAPYERISCQLIGVEIVASNGQRQLFTAAVKA
jgi:hypothetical protein